MRVLFFHKSFDLQSDGLRIFSDFLSKCAFDDDAKLLLAFGFKGGGVFKDIEILGLQGAECKEQSEENLHGAIL